METNKFLTSSYKWVDWITVFDTGIPYKNIWIFAITHWNEPVWLEVFEYFEKNIKSKVTSWKVFLITINIKAYEKYIADWDIYSNRFLDSNMNRIYNTNFIENDYEHSRLKELLPIFSELDIVLDLHSVPIWDNSIWISSSQFLEDSKQFLDVENTMIWDIWTRNSLITYFLEKNKPAFWIECGNHISDIWLHNGINNLRNILIYYWFMSWDIIKNIWWKDIFEFYEEIYPISSDFKYSKIYGMFEELNTWEIYWIDNETIYKNDTDEKLYIWLLSKKIIPWDWCGFLFKKIL